MTSTKTCSKCGKEKPFSEFNKRKRSKDGYYIWCKDCAKKYQAEWYKQNKARIDEQHRKYRRENVDKIRASYRKYYYSEQGQKRVKEYRKKTYERAKEYHRQYRKNNIEHIRKRQREYYHKNKDKHRVWKKRWEETHQEELKAYRKRYGKENREKINKKAIERLHNDPIHKMKEQTRNMVRYALRSKGHRKTSRTAEIVGCDLDTLCEHLFATWEKNYGTKWNGEEYHIDHIVPLATAKTDEDIVKLCHYTNLQLLTPEDNMAKSDKIEFF